MSFFSKNNGVRFGLLMLLVLTFGAVRASSQSQHPVDSSNTRSRVQPARTADVTDIINNPDQYDGKQVTVDWKLDRVYSPTTIGLEKDEKHMLVVSVGPGPFPAAQMKKNEPVTLTGTVRKFDPDALQREYGTMDFGKAPLNKVGAVLIIGSRQSARAEQPAQPGAATPSALPRTASPLPLLGLAGLMFVVLGLGVPLLRRQ
jgi:hypothetical protein